MPAPHDPRALPPPPGTGPPERPFPPMITYRALAGQPRLVRFVVATAVLPLEITVSGVRTLHALESVLSELAAHLRALRPAVSAASDAYAAGHFDPVFRTIDRVQTGTDVFAVVWAPIATVREVFVPNRSHPNRSHPNRPHPEPPVPTVVPPSGPVDPAVRERGWFSWLGPTRR